MQARFAASAAQPRGVNSDFALSGLLHCARCDERLTGERARRRTALGGHLDYYRRSPSPTRDVPCPACRHRIPAEAIEGPVLDAVAMLADHPTVRRAVAAERAARVAGADMLAARRAALAAEAARVKQHIDNLLRLVEKGGAVAERVGARLDALNAEARRIELQREALDVDTEVDGTAALAARVAAFPDVWAHAGPAERKEAIRCFVARVDVDAERGTVRIAVRRPDRTAA